MAFGKNCERGKSPHVLGVGKKLKLRACIELGWGCQGGVHTVGVLGKNQIAGHCCE